MFCKRETLKAIICPAVHIHWRYIPYYTWILVEAAVQISRRNIQVNEKENPFMFLIWRMYANTTFICRSLWGCSVSYHFVLLFTARIHTYMLSYTYYVRFCATRVMSITCTDGECVKNFILICMNIIVTYHGCLRLQLHSYMHCNEHASLVTHFSLREWANGQMWILKSIIFHSKRETQCSHMNGIFWTTSVRNLNKTFRFTNIRTFCMNWKKLKHSCIHVCLAIRKMLNFVYVELRSPITIKQNWCKLLTFIASILPSYNTRN